MKGLSECIYVGLQHVQVGRVGRYIPRFRHQVAAHVLIGQRVGQPRQVIVILQRRCALADLAIYQKRSAMARCKDRLAIADGHAPLWVTGVDGELRRDRL